MDYTRTQIYLPPSEHKELKEEAKRLNISLAELLRRLVHRYLEQKARPSLSRDDFMSIVGLGASGHTDISEEHDKYIAEIIADENIR